MNESTRTVSVHGGLVDRLGSAIVQGRYAPYERLVTGEIAEEAGVSRSAAREAVRVLESLNLVRVRRKAGVEVLPAAEWNVYAPEVIEWRLTGPRRSEQLRDLSQLRSAIEPLAARLAANAASEGQRREMLEAVLEMTDNQHDANGDAYLAADARFHRALLVASGNPMLAALADVVEAVLVGRTRHDLMPSDANPDALAWHRDVAFAIASRNSEEASAAMARIVDEADEAMASGAGRVV